MLKTTFNPTSKLWNPAERRRAFSNVPVQSAKNFKRGTQERMIQQQPQGKLVEKKRKGAGFRRFHRQSARGQRPQPDTLTLVNAVSDRRTGELSAEVFIADKVNPENKSVASNYALKLVRNLGRQIFSKSDLQFAQIEFTVRANKALLELL